MTRVLQIEYRGSLAPYEFEADSLREVGATLDVVRLPTEPELIERAADADVLWSEWEPSINRAVLEQLPRCGLVVRWGVGVDNIDIDAATELGVAVANAPNYCTVDVAEHAMGLVLALARRIVATHEGMRVGLWTVPGSPPRRLSEATIGVIGLGRIGRRVAGLAAAFGARVHGFDLTSGSVPGVALMGLSELLATSDFVSLHLPLTPSTRHIINGEKLAAMRPGACLVNTGRGGLVDHDALVDALCSGALGGAALDVFEPEPLPAEHPLRTLPMVILTPHQAASSDRSTTALRHEVVDTTRQWIMTDWADTIINPEVRTRRRRNSRR